MLEKFFQKYKIRGSKSHTLDEFKSKIEILSTHDLLCRKIATYCMPTFLTNNTAPYQHRHTLECVWVACRILHNHGVVSQLYISAQKAQRCSPEVFFAGILFNNDITIDDIVPNKKWLIKQIAMIQQKFVSCV